jgi:RecB family exonuclease
MPQVCGLWGSGDAEMKQQLHVSGLNLLSRCGIAYEFRYLRRLPELRSVSLAVGSAVDRSVTADLTKKKDSGKLLPADEVHDIARDALLEEWARGDIVVDEADAEDGWSGSKGDAVDASVDMAGFHHKAAAPAIEPTAVQRRWVLDINGMDLQLAGTIDIQEGLKAIRDTKTAAKSPVRDLADKSLQLTTYSLAVRQLDGRIPEAVQLDYVVRTPKRKDLKLVQLQSKRTDADMGHLVRRIEQAARVIESGMFSPAPPDAWYCSHKYCSFFEICPYAARPVTIAA